ncbi:MAG: ATP-binding protein [Planctomycetota bacterium]
MTPMRFAVVGGESTGKSTLARALADALACPLAEEFARDYLTEHGSNYTPDQSLTIAEGQLIREDAAVAEAVRTGRHCVICDTDALSTLIWSEFYFGEQHAEVRRLAESRRYALHLLCTPDHLEWEDDGLRQSPTSRPWFTERFTQEISHGGGSLLCLDQPPDQRLGIALEHIRPMLDAAADLPA